MSTATVPAVETNTATHDLEQDRSLIIQLLELIKSTGKILVLHLRPGGGEVGANKQKCPVLVKNVDVHVGGKAWVGLELNGLHYRTETIECRKAFMEWVARSLKWLKKQVEDANEAFKARTTITVSGQVCFIPARRLTVVET